MKNVVSLILAVIFCSNLLFAQNRQNYSELIKEARYLYQQKEFFKSGEKYSQAFASSEDRGIVEDRYNAACSWALASEPDSSFIQLFKIAKNGNYTDLYYTTTDSNLASLHSDKRWSEVVEIVMQNKDYEYVKRNSYLCSVYTIRYISTYTHQPI